MENRRGNFHSTGIRKLFISEKIPQITELRRKKIYAISYAILVIAIFHYSISMNNYQGIIIFSCHQCARSRNIFFYFFYIPPQCKAKEPNTQVELAISNRSSESILNNIRLDKLPKIPVSKLNIFISSKFFWSFLYPFLHFFLSLPICPSKFCSYSNCSIWTSINPSNLICNTGMLRSPQKARKLVLYTLLSINSAVTFLQNFSIYKISEYYLFHFNKKNKNEFEKLLR